MNVNFLFFLISPFLFYSCNRDNAMAAPASFIVKEILVDNQPYASENKGVSSTPKITMSFNQKLDASSITPNIQLKDGSGTNYAFNYSTSNKDSTLTITVKDTLRAFTKLYFSLFPQIKSTQNQTLNTSVSFTLLNKIDSKNKFPSISDDSLLTLTQQQTFKYFWDFGHPVSGLSRERNTSGNTCTTGGTGFGIQSIIVAVQRNFISRSAGRARIQLMANFLDTKAKKYHGAFAHWLDGSSGQTIPFSQYDDGGDLVETSYLMAGLLTARAYFDANTPEETQLRALITKLYEGVEWSWYQQNNQQVLYWHWSENYAWKMNHKVQGWNEALIMYILAASSPTFPITKSVYQNGWANNGGMKNGKTFYNYVLPLGPNLGGPLFFEQYTFLGIDPNGLTDDYADYQLQTKNHTLINYEYCKANPRNYYGYSANCWGLTASDTYDGYTAHEPNNDRGVISPTAALSSIAFTPTESMQALRHFYYILGDKIWKEYGFVDAFSLDKYWFANSFLAIDQGPIIVMIENHRSKLIWNLLSGDPMVKDGMRKLGFKAPYL